MDIWIGLWRVDEWMHSSVESGCIGDWVERWNGRKVERWTGG